MAEWWPIGSSLGDSFLRLLVAVICGMVIGWEREIRHRPAGLRTHMLVALGAASFTLIAMKLLSQTANQEHLTGANPFHIIGGVVSGIGFLGAGAILQSRGNVKGLTTASGIWAVASIGVAAGAGLFWIALFVTGLALIILAVLRSLERSHQAQKQAEKQH